MHWLSCSLGSYNLSNTSSKMVPEPLSKGVCFYKCSVWGCALILVSVLLTWFKLELPGTRNLNWEKASIRLPVGKSVGGITLIKGWREESIQLEVVSPRDGGSEWYKKAGWASHEEQASKQCSRFSSALISYPDFLQWWTVMWKCKWNKLFPP